MSNRHLRVWQILWPSLKTPTLKELTWHVRKCAEIGQKWEIEVFFRLELNYTSAPIAQLAARLTFFI